MLCCRTESPLVHTIVERVFGFGEWTIVDEYAADGAYPAIIECWILSGRAEKIQLLANNRAIVFAGAFADADAIVGGGVARTVGGDREHHVESYKRVKVFPETSMRPWQIGEEVCTVPAEANAGIGESKWHVARHVICPFEVDKVGYGECITWPDYVFHRKTGNDVVVGSDMTESLVEPCEIRYPMWQHGQIMIPDEILPSCGGWIVNMAAGVPLAIPHGDESVGDVWDAPHEGGALGYDLHGFSLKFEV